MEAIVLLSRGKYVGKERSNQRLVPLVRYTSLEQKFFETAWKKVIVALPTHITELQQSRLVGTDLIVVHPIKEAFDVAA